MEKTNTIENSKIINKFYLDKEKDIIVNLYKTSEDELTYILETPNHGTGNLITNLAKICGLKTIKNEKDMKIIKGKIPASLNGDNEEVYIFRLGGIKIANIYADGKIEIKATIPAISKTLMSQTKRYNLSINQTLVKSYILKNPAILVSGHDLRDLEMLLEQTKGTGVDVYTHSEMLPACSYPAFKKYPNFVGNYGNAWWQQKEEFEKFNGPILMTTNCIVPPKESYKDRLYTTGATGYPGCKHITGGYGEKKDFSQIIEHAKKCPPPTEIEHGEIYGGFAHAQVVALADKVVDAVKSGAIKKFVVMAGCDGRAKSREYYTEFAKALPKDTVILTAGCAKYRYNKLDLGMIGDIPRVLDAGQCNDSYSLVVIAMKLKEAFGLDDINELPIIYNIAWYEQKAVLVLLALLSLGIKNIHLGPTLPAFLSPEVVDVLVDKFDIAGITTVQNDMDIFFG